uniref:Uncharacterized protein n=1 Tax=Populus alba TaxID=43335 RepID=A0A4U5M9T7_POPAL|nr:hypothetical protein D5086_0000317640 [Populus alba]
MGSQYRRGFGFIIFSSKLSWSRSPSLQASEITNSSHLSLFPTLPDISVVGIMDGSTVSCEEEEFIPGAASMLSSASMVDIKWVFDHLAGVQGPGTSKSLVLGFWRDLFLGTVAFIFESHLRDFLLMQGDGIGHHLPLFFSILFLQTDILEGLSFVRPSPHVVWLLWILGLVFYSLQLDCSSTSYSCWNDFGMMRFTMDGGWTCPWITSLVVGVVCLLVWSSPWVEALLLLLYAAGFAALLVAGCCLLLEVQVVGGVCLLGCFVPCWFLGASLLLLLYAAGFAALLDAGWIILLAAGSAGCRHCSPDG